MDKKQIILIVGAIAAVFGLYFVLQKRDAVVQLPQIGQVGSAPGPDTTGTELAFKSNIFSTYAQLLKDQFAQTQQTARTTLQSDLEKTRIQAGVSIAGINDAGQTSRLNISDAGQTARAKIFADADVASAGQRSAAELERLKMLDQIAQRSGNQANTNAILQGLLKALGSLSGGGRSSGGGGASGGGGQPQQGQQGQQGQGRQNPYRTPPFVPQPNTGNYFPSSFPDMFGQYPQPNLPGFGADDFYNPFADFFDPFFDPLPDNYPIDGGGIDADPILSLPGDPGYIDPDSDWGGFDYGEFFGFGGGGGGGFDGFGDTGSAGYGFDYYPDFFYEENA